MARTPNIATKRVSRLIPQLLPLYTHVHACRRRRVIANGDNEMHCQRFATTSSFGENKEDPSVVSEALRFLDRVRKEFWDRPLVYYEFENILTKFNTKEMDTTEVVTNVRSLFRGHCELIEGFNAFLPDTYRITIDDDDNDDGEPSSRAAAASTNRPTDESSDQGAETTRSLLRGHCELIQGFASFRPDTYRVTIDDDCSVETQTSRVDAEINPPAAESSDEEADATQEQPDDEESEADLKRAAEYVIKVKTKFPYDTVTFKCFLALLTGCQSGQVELKDGFDQVSLLFADELELIEGFICFLPAKIQDYAKEQLARIERESHLLAKTKQPDFGTCTLCMDRPRSHSFVPCGHLCACGFCASLTWIRSGCCPICSQKPIRVMRVFLP